MVLGEKKVFFKKRYLLILILLLILIGESGGNQQILLPLFSYAGKYKNQTNVIQDNLLTTMPLFEFSRYNNHFLLVQDDDISEKTKQRQLKQEEPVAESDSVLNPKIEEKRIEEYTNEGTKSADEVMSSDINYIPSQKQAIYQWDTLTDYKTLVSTFYTIDKNALGGEDLFNLDKLKNQDLRIQKNENQPQILIYHTHSTENYADSLPGSKEQGVVGVGDYLSKILTEVYGYQVMHHTTEYDTIRDEAYAKSLPALTELIREYPSIEVVIDLHRDSMNENRDMTLDINGKRTARFMFFNGISRNRQNGDIAYLSNPNLSTNLAFSFQMQVALGEYYPGLTRKIYVKQYRYNMHLCPRTLLIELGDESNTFEEAKNACLPLADILNMVLTGETR